jgi:hypothetical protein
LNVAHASYHKSMVKEDTRHRNKEGIPSNNLAYETELFDLHPYRFTILA